MRFVVPLWLTFVTVISVMPTKLKDSVGATGVLHNPGHFLVFFITAVLVCRNASNPASRLVRWIGICCFALAIEFLECATYHNRMEWRDVLVDFLGAAVALAILSMFSLGSDSVQGGEI